MASLVVTSLATQGWEIFQEVDLRSRCGVADIVAVKGPLLHVVECKRSLGFAVLDQAAAWRKYAHLVSVATEAWSGRQRVADEVLRLLGLGWLRVGYDGVQEYIAPAFRRHVGASLRNTLREEHKHYAMAGTNGGYFTQWRGTCARLAEAVGAEPGRTVAEYVKVIAHHYANEQTARACLLRDVHAGKVVGVCAKESPWSNRRVTLHPAHAPDQAPRRAGASGPEGSQ